jgi:enoyl-CoA hydratase
MDYKFLRVEPRGPVALIYINRPPMNALNIEVLVELKRALKELAISSGTQVVVITGEGKAFVAGADIAEMRDMDALRAREYATLGQSVFFDIENLPQPAIAAVNGFALGGGCELAMACDIRIASDTAVFGQPEVKLAVIPGFGGTQRLPQLIGCGKAKELILTGDLIDAAEAHRLGLVNRVTRADDLLQEVTRTAELIASRGPIAVRLAKKAVRLAGDVDLRSGCAMEAELFARCFSTEDQKEGMGAFLEKRKPDFKAK